ncbi:hypothetical protein RQP46_007557 [Phenoliferia psychrophenolica]
MMPNGSGTGGGAPAALDAPVDYADPSLGVPDVHGTSIALLRTLSHLSNPPTPLPDPTLDPTAPHLTEVSSSLPLARYVGLADVGLADGTVVAVRHVFQLLDTSLATAHLASQPYGSAPPSTPVTAILSLPKFRVMCDVKEPITGLGLRTTAGGGHRSTTTTLYILTRSHVLSNATF